MDPMVDIPTVSTVARAAQPLYFREAEYVPFLQKVGKARIVLMGESTLGTHEFYRERSWITKRLLKDYGFAAVAVEADWPDALRIHRYLTGTGADHTPLDAIGSFRHFPAWMWRNMDMLAFLEWAHKQNHRLTQPIGFFGLDRYRMHASNQLVLHYLETMDREVAARARYRYACFDEFGENSEAEGYADGFSLPESYEHALVHQLTEELQHSLKQDSPNAGVPPAITTPEQTKALQENAENYYKTTFRDSTEAWNLRVRHMAETLEQLLSGPEADRKIVVWMQNTNAGDARATELAERGRISLGQLLREKFGDEAVLIGLTTYSGELTASADWGAVAERKLMNRALPQSYEAVFHETGIQDFLLCLKDDPAIRMVLARPRLERAIGVVYRPGNERICHYMECRLAEQFDYIIHFDRTRALVPLEKNQTWEPSTETKSYPHAV